MKYKRALIIGRFQPFHFGHLYLIKKTLEIAEKIIIGVGSASIFDENNPLDYKTREKIIKKVFVNEEFENRLEKIVPLEDFFNDEKWLKNVVKKTGSFDIVVSNNEWTNSIMEKNGYKVIRFPYYKRYLYEGLRIRKLIKQGKKWEERVPSYIKYQISNIKYVYKKSNIFKYVVIGGTFDHFHKGHRALIKSTLKYGKKIIIGITSNNFVKNKFLSEIIEDFKVRKNNVSNFLKKEKATHKALIIKINNFLGDLDKRKKVDAIIVSKNTYYNALKINEIREKNKLSKLRIIIQKDVLADDGQILSSERIRKGEIDRKGRCYWLLVNSYLGKEKKELILPENLKKELRKPFGKIFKSTSEVLKFIKLLKPVMTIAVGDIIVSSLLEKKFDPNIKIIDFYSRKKPLDKKFQITSIKHQITNKSQISSTKSQINPKYQTLNSKQFQNSNNKNSKQKNFENLDLENSDLFAAWNLGLGTFVNRSGTINIKTAEKLRTVILGTVSNRNSSYFIINGEEDLLALPAILFAPLGSLVLYGHWQYGVIGVIVNEKIKNKIIKIIYQFN